MKTYCSDRSLALRCRLDLHLHQLPPDPVSHYFLVPWIMSDFLSISGSVGPMKRFGHPTTSSVEYSDQEMSRQTSSLILHRISTKLADTTERLHQCEERCTALTMEGEACRTALRATEAACAAAQFDAANARARLAAAEKAALAEEERRNAAENAMKQRNAELRASFLANEQAVARAEALAARLTAEAAVLDAALANACAACQLRLDDVDAALRAAGRRRAAELRALLGERRRLNADLASLANYLAVRSQATSRPAAPPKDPHMAGPAGPARRRALAEAAGRGTDGVDGAAGDAEGAVVAMMGRAGEETYETLQRLWGEVGAAATSMTARAWPAAALQRHAAAAAAAAAAAFAALPCCVCCIRCCCCASLCCRDPESPELPLDKSRRRCRLDSARARAAVAVPAGGQCESAARRAMRGPGGA